MNKDTLIVGGFEFPSYKEAEIAIKEAQSVEVIRQRLSTADGHALYELYTKIIGRDMFHTMVGYSFLSEMRYRLIHEFQYDEDMLPVIKLPKRMEYDQVEVINKGVTDLKLKRLVDTKKKMKITIFVLVFMIVAMFIIAAVNPNVGYINAENKVLNKYSAWEEDLKQREQEIRDKEAELNLNIEE